jgi:hypothetical protein
MEAQKKIRMKKSFLCCIIILIIISCHDGRQGEKAMKETLKSIANVIFLGKAVKDTHYLEIPDDERIRRADLYRAVDYRKPEVLKALLEAGADPNECLGVEGWISNNPLQMVIRRCDSTYSRMKRGEAIPDPLPDVAMMNILLEAGADIDRRPYVWSTVVLGDNMWIKHIQDSTTQKANGEFIKTQEEADEEKHLYVYDNNRLLKAFLEAGANPDKPGHPVPYSTAKEYLYISDE